MRQSKRQIIKFERVESIEVIKFADRERIEQLCPSGFVYDIEIEDNHNYLAEDILVHNCAAFPKASKYQKDIRKRFCKVPMIFLSGTPTPESFSQWFHQLQVSNSSPFKEYTTFYKWANDYVNITEQNLGYARVKVYKDGIESKIMEKVKPYVLTFTQAEAGFTSTVNEHILYCDMLPITYEIIKRLKRDKVVDGKSGLILGDTGVKLMQKVHQLSSGTCKFEDGTSKVIDYSKAEFIKEKFNSDKIAIFYKFKEELNALKSVYGDILTEDLDEFNSTYKCIALQIVSAREGISLKNAKYLVYYNIDFSATSYWQSRARLATIERPNNDIYWIFSRGGIEEKIYKAVMNKKNYTLSNFKRENVL